MAAVQTKVDGRKSMEQGMPLGGRMPFSSLIVSEGHFTRREDQILRLIAADRSDKEIALTLGISTHTLRTHLARVYQRYRVHSRAAAVAAWLGFSPPTR